MAENEISRRFSGVGRLYGQTPFERICRSHVAVIGVGGVGSWAVEALVRSGVRRLTLVDMDVVAESNTNRQIQAVSENFGKAKVQVLKERALSINPNIEVVCCDQFLQPENCQEILEHERLDGLIEATDQISAKLAVCMWALQNKHRATICVGAAGGKKDPVRIRTADLSEACYDPLLAKVRSRLRRTGSFVQGKPMRVPVVFSEEPMAQNQAELCAVGNLSCVGYGSSVCVTAGFGFAAAAWVMKNIGEGKVV